MTQQQPGYDPPNYMMVPIAWYSQIPAIKDASELKVTLAIFRRTFGWHKRDDKISLSQLRGETGMTQKAVVAGTEKALARGTITREPDGDSYVYSVHIYYDQKAPPLVLREPPAPAAAPETEAARAVFAHWLELCQEYERQPRSRDLTPSRLRLLTRALKEASVDECKAALTGMFVDEWFREHDKWDMRHVFQTGPHTRRTLREQIDWFIDKAEQVGRGFAIASVDPEKLNRAKRVILEAHDLQGNETVARRAVSAEKWLEQNGVIVDREGQRPIFKAAS